MSQTRNRFNRLGLLQPTPAEAFALKGKTLDDTIDVANKFLTILEDATLNYPDGEPGQILAMRIAGASGSRELDWSMSRFAEHCNITRACVDDLLFHLLKLREYLRNPSTKLKPNEVQPSMSLDNEQIEVWRIDTDLQELATVEVNHFLDRASRVVAQMINEFDLVLQKTKDLPSMIETLQKEHDDAEKEADRLEEWNRDQQDQIEELSDELDDARNDLRVQHRYIEQLEMKLKLKIPRPGDPDEAWYEEYHEMKAKMGRTQEQKEELARKLDDELAKAAKLHDELAKTAFFHAQKEQSFER